MEFEELKEIENITEARISHSLIKAYKCDTFI